MAGESLSPYGTREGKCPGGPADPVAIWREARRLVGIEGPAKPTSLGIIAQRYVELSQEIASKGEMACGLFEQSDGGEGRRAAWRNSFRLGEIGAEINEAKGRNDVPGAKGVPTELPSDSLNSAPGVVVKLGLEGRVALLEDETTVA